MPQKHMAWLGKRADPVWEGAPRGRPAPYRDRGPPRGSIRAAGDPRWGHRVGAESNPVRNPLRPTLSHECGDPNTGLEWVYAESDRGTKGAKTSPVRAYAIVWGDSEVPGVKNNLFWHKLNFTANGHLCSIYLGNPTVIINTNIRGVPRLRDRYSQFATKRDRKSGLVAV